MIGKDKAGAARKSTRGHRRAKPATRMRVLAAFRALGHGTDATTAREQVHAFYRASGAEWARCLR